MKLNLSLNNLPKPAKTGLIIILSLSIVGIAYSLLQRLGYIFPITLWREVMCESCPQAAAYHQPLTRSSINTDRSLSTILGDRIDRQQTSILIEKSKYRLTIYQRRQPIKSYPIVLGDNPTGDKFIEGDRRTPEGIFQIRDLYPHPQWSKFLWIDYPTAHSWQKHLTAKKTGKIPWYATIGRDVGIHGVPANGDAMVDKQINWTWGCISVKTADIQEIYKVAQPGTLVEILP